MDVPSGAAGGANLAGQLAPGARFGTYVIVQTLGVGTFGAVYEALRQPLGRRVALKVLHERLVHDGEALERFVREARAGAQFQHPYIVDTQDVGEVGGVPFIAMEFLDGETLGQRLKREGAMPVAEALDLMLPIVSAVAAIHERGVVHRDLKPGNLFLARSLRGTVPKLLDFGIAKLRDPATERDGPLTQTTALLGTPPYMSPEQARQSRDVDPRSDQFALGAIVYECLTGQRAFHGASVLEVLTHVTSGEVVPPRVLAPAVPAPVEAAVMRALTRDRDGRFGSVRELGRALVPFASPTTQLALDGEFAAPETTRHATRESAVPVVHLHETVRATPPVSLSPVQVSTTPPSPPPRRRVWLAVSAAALALCGAAVTARVVTRATPATAEPHATATHEAAPAVVEAPPAAVVAPSVEAPAVTASDEAARGDVDASATPSRAPLHPRPGAGRVRPQGPQIGNF